MTHHDIVQEFLRQKADALVRADGVFFERVLHSEFIYVNTRGVRLDRAGYVSRIASPGEVRFASQEVGNLIVTSIGDVAIGHMTLRDTFTKGTERRTFTYQSLCVFRIQDGTSCEWIAGQKMLPEPRD